MIRGNMKHGGSVVNNRGSEGQNLETQSFTVGVFQL